MILEEANEPVLNRGGPKQVISNSRCRPVSQLIVKPLVVAGVESLFQQTRLKIPVGLSNKAEFWMGSPHPLDYFCPVLLSGDRPRALIPSLRENLVHHQHRHVT